MFSTLSRGTIGVVACVLAIGTMHPEAAARFAPDPCKVLTPGQINSATGFAVGAGTPIVAGKSCQWISPEPKRGIATVNFWPADSWAKMTNPIAVSNETSVSGVGDGAYYLNAGTYGALSVKKGSAVFVLKVYNVPPDKQQAVLKALANAVIANL
jgi:hypothetical protein